MSGYLAKLLDERCGKDCLNKDWPYPECYTRKCDRLLTRDDVKQLRRRVFGFRYY